jgi:hypothetical protein
MTDPREERPVAVSLSEEEAAALAACEATVEENLGAWVNVTNALLEIHQRRLYRGTHTSFESYVDERFGVSRAHGHRLVLNARVRLSPVGDRLTSERQAREIASLLDDPEMLVRVVDRAAELRGDKPLTGASLRQAKAELLASTDEDRVALRQAWTLAELTDELVIEGEMRRQEHAKRFLEVPPQAWPIIYRRWAKHHHQPDPSRALRWHLERLAQDADLTDKVVEVLRLAVEHEYLPTIASAFDDVDKATRVLQELAPQGDRLFQLPEHASEQLVAFRDALQGAGEVGVQIGVGAARTVAERLAAVVVVCATDPRPLRRLWTVEEVEQALREARRAEPRGITRYVPGSVGIARMQMQEYSVVLHEGLKRIRIKMDGLQDD